MAIPSFKIRQLFESYTKGNPANAKGRIAFVDEIRHMLGLADKHGNAHKDQDGNAVLKEQKIKPSEFTLREIAEGIFGSTTTGLLFDDTQKGTMARVLGRLEELKAAGVTDRKVLMESMGVGVDPTSFLNVNTFTGVVGGLIESKILEAFQNPDYVMDQIFKTENSKVVSFKFRGVTPLGDVAKRRKPGEAHPTAEYEERWVQSADTYETALAVHVKKEAVFFDDTGNVLREAAKVGDALRLRKEIEQTDVFIGKVNNFNLDGTAYNTYQTARTVGYKNDHDNAFLDWTSFNTAEMLFAEMQDPKTGLPINASPDKIVCVPYNEVALRMATSAMEIGSRTGSGSPAQTASNPLVTMKSAYNPYSKYAGGVISSKWIYKRLTDADGLNLGASAAQGYWWMVDTRGDMPAFVYIQNWPLTVQQSSPTSWNMLNNGLVGSYFANQRGVPMALMPWKVVRNKKA